MDTVRGVERAIAAARRGDDVPEEFDVAPLGEITEEEWREHWPIGCDRRSTIGQSPSPSETDGEAESAAEESTADATPDDA